MKNYTIRDFDADFPNDDACLQWIREHRWVNGIRCRKCLKITKHHRVKNRTCYECDYCGTQVYPTVGTIFQKSTTPLRSWFYAIYQMASTGCAISAKELQRQLGVTYKTAWRIVKQVRSMLNEDVMVRLAEAEVKQSQFGGKRQPSSGAAKIAEVGGLQRRGKVKRDGQRRRPFTRSDFEAVLKAATKPVEAETWRHLGAFDDFAGRITQDDEADVRRRRTTLK